MTARLPASAPAQSHAAAAIEFAAGRSRSHATAYLAMAAVLFAVILASLVRLIEAGESIIAPAVLATAVGFYCWQTLTQFLDRSPKVVVAADGLGLPDALSERIPWSRILALEFRSAFRGARLDVAVDAEIYDRLKIGQRFMGDHIVRRRGWPNGFSILAFGLDTDGEAIFKAARRHWPPA